MIKKFKEYILEGVNDPSIFKCVFLAGGPGSGKSFIVGKTSLKALGFKIVNSDDIFEIKMSKEEMELTPENIFSDKGQTIRNQSKQLSDKRLKNYLLGRLGLVIDGTGKDFEKIKSQKEMMDKLGYESMLLLVNTDEKTSLERNRKRDRSLPDSKVSEFWKKIQNNIGKFQNLFGNNFIVVDNSDGSDYEKITFSVYKKVDKWRRILPKNKMVNKWIKSQKN